MDEEYDSFSQNDVGYIGGRIGAISMGGDGRPRSTRTRMNLLGGREMSYGERSREDDVASAPDYSAFNRGPRPPAFRSSAARSYRAGADAYSVGEGMQGRAIRQPMSNRRPHPPIQNLVSEEQFSLTNASAAYEGAMSREATIETLKAKGFSTGLARELAANAFAFANRIWIVDNSGSMVVDDGRRIIPKSDGKMTEQRVSRWEELQDTVLYHAEMAATLNSPTVFRLLNDPGPQVGPQEFSVAQRPPGVGNVQQDIRRIRTAMQRAKPLGVTPLTTHILQIQHALRQMAPRLRREGKRVAIILATDGLPTDSEGFGGDEITEEFVHALKTMEGLPIWLVIRLCTDEEKVTNFYNALDGRFELSLEVLDDFAGEAAEVHRHNKWLNYSMPLHRCRELGYHDRLFDLIDERPLTKGELRDFCALLFGYEVQQLPDPNIDWKDFIKVVQECVAKEPTQYDPIRKKVLPLIHVRVLNRVYGKKKCTIM